MKKADSIIAAGLIILAGFVISMAKDFPSMGGSDIGSGYFPKMAAYILILLSLIMVISSWLKKTKKTEEEGNKPDWKRPLASIIGTGIYLILVEFLGFYIATPIFLLGFLWFMNFRKPIMTIAVVSILTLFVFVVFQLLLKVPMPSSSLFG